MVERRRRTVADRTRLTNRLTALLKAYFPQALDWAGDLRGRAACEFRCAWPSLEACRRRAVPNSAGSIMTIGGCRRKI